MVAGPICCTARLLPLPPAYTSSFLTKQVRGISQHIGVGDAAGVALGHKRDLAQVQHSSDNFVEALDQLLVEPDAAQRLGHLSVASFVVQVFAWSGILQFEKRVWEGESGDRDVYTFWIEVLSLRKSVQALPV